MLLFALSRLTLMLYELSSLGNEKPRRQRLKTPEGKPKILDMAYQGVGNRDTAKMGIALRSPDYEGYLPSCSVFRRHASQRPAPPWMGGHAYNGIVKPSISSLPCHIAHRTVVSASWGSPYAIGQKSA